MTDKKEDTISVNREDYLGSKLYRNTLESKEKANRFLVMVSGAELIIIILLVLALIASFFTRPKDKVLAMTPDLKVFELTTKDVVSNNDSAIRGFATKVVRDTLSLDFKRWKEQLSDVKKFYNPNAFKKMVASLKASGNLQSIVERKLVSSVTIDGAPIIKNEGVLRGKKAWNIEVPFILTYEGSSSEANVQYLNAKVLLMEEDLSDHKEGVAVHKITFETRRR
jgi:hypothetical protein